MKYNTQRQQLILPEYGRTIQEMVDICVGIEDREERQQCANTIVRIMTIMNPTVRQQPNFEHRLWDHLAIMSDYKLDIDWPFPIVQKAEIQARPKPLKYPMQRIRYRHYGHLLEASMRKLQQLTDAGERQALCAQLANAMKQDLYDFNRGALDERKIRADIESYTEGTVALPDNFTFQPITGGRVMEKSRKKKRK